MSNMQPWMLADTPDEVKIGWRTVTHKTFTLPDGSQEDYTTYGSKRDRSGGVIALTADNQVIIAEQFRPGPEIVMQELPGGGIEPGEDPQEAALRELREETGYTSDDVVFLGAVHRDAYMNGTWYYYLARNCRQEHEQDLDHGELIDVRLIPIEDFIQNAKTGKMSDANAVLIAYDILQAIAREQ